MYKCKFCEKICKNDNSKRNHERLCKNNPDRQFTFFQLNKNKKEPWNKGLKADSDGRVKKNIESIKRFYTTHHSHQFGKPRTEFEKLAISSTMKNNPKAGGIRKGSGRGKKGWYGNFFCDSTYELVYVIYNIDHNIDFKRSKLSYEYSYNNQVHKFYPDFELSDGTLVEIKGYYNEQVEAKIKSVKDRKIIVLMKEDLKYAFDYVKKNYSYKKLEDLYNTSK